jgi:hypothetical protein
MKAIETLSIPSKETKLPFTHILVSEIELINGGQTQIIVSLDASAIDFELLNIGINHALTRCRNVRRSKNTVCLIRNGKLKPYIFFKETIHKYE